MRNRMLAFLAALALIFGASPLMAVTKHISLVGADGQPLANTTITIEFPDGTTKEEKTDDRGILVFDFPGKGTYRILGPNGELLQTVAVGAAALSGTAVAIAGGVIGAVAIAANSDSDDTAGSGSTSTTTDPSGTYDLTFSLASNPGSHPDLLTGDTVTTNFSVSGSSASMTETSTNADFPDSMSGSVSGTSMTLSGSGTYSGFPTTFTYTGSFDAAAGTLSGTLTAGGSGLPGGQPISWNVSGTRR